MIERNLLPGDHPADSMAALTYVDVASTTDQ